MYVHIIVYNISHIMLDCIYNPWTKKRFGTNSMLENWKS